MSTGTVALESRGGIGWITLDRPAKLNSLAGDMREQLRARIGEAAANKDLYALVVTGAGRAFCAGGDVETMANLQAAGDAAGFHRILHAGAECVLALQAFPGLTIAAVNGVAAGAGFSLALGCDLRIAAHEARFAASWGGIGLAPDWGATFWLPQMLGYARAAELVLGGGVLEAVEAHRLGLVMEVVEGALLLDRVQRVAERLGAGHDRVRQVRALLRKGATGSLEASLAAETEVQEDLFEGDEVAKGLAAFREKRGS